MKLLVALFLVAAVVLPACHPVPPLYRWTCTSCFGSDTTGKSFSDTVSKPYAVWATNACFNDDSFYNIANFSNTVFHDSVSFTDATFLKSSNFSSAEFDQPVYFDDVSFAKHTYFDNVQFSHYAKFTNLQHTDSLAIQFVNARLPDTLDFSENPDLACKIDLTSANFDRPGSFDTVTGDYERPHAIFFFNTDISKFHLDYFHFRLLLPDSTITPSFGERRQRITKDQQEAMYEALLNNFKLAGEEESYKRLDIEYQKFKWANSWAHAIWWIPKIWWNYGYDKEYVFWWILVSLGVFIFANVFFLRTLNRHVYEVLPPREIEENTGFRNRLWLSGIYTGNIFFRLSLDRECMRFERFWATVYFFGIYILGVLCLGYLANFILQH